MKKKIVTLGPCPKHYTYDQDKACTPEETVARFQERLRATRLDVLKEIRRIDNGRLDIPVYFSMCGEDALRTIGNKKQMGKGSTPEQSRASACMELGERFSFFSFLRDEDNFLYGDYAAMEASGYPVLPIEALLQSVHDTALPPALLRQLLAGLPMRWTWALRLGDQTPLLVPFSWFYAINEFNGPSAGNTYEEAVLQGISEVVERHVCALITRDRIATPAIDPTSIADPVAKALLAKFNRNGIEVHLRDFSLDTGIPTVGALAWDPSTFPQSSEIVYTAGTTPDATKALIRALTEVAQLAGDFNSGSNYVASGLPKPLNLDEVDYVVHSGRTVRLDQMADLQAADIFQEVNNCVAALKRQEMDVLVVDTTHPELGIPAVYTIIPGAHFRERAMGGNAALFAAKLAADLLAGEALDAKLADMQQVLPGAYYLHFYRGRHLYEQGRADEALACFGQALTLQPATEDLPYLCSYQGSCLRDLARYEEAIMVLTQGLDYDEERPDIYNTLGVCCYKIGRHDEAVGHFRRAVELNPVSAIDYANLALNLERLGEREAAIANYEIALSQDAAIGFAVERLAGLLAEKGTDAGGRMP
ncbi:MAG: YcaO-like family protein [Desulfobulbus sp.]|jgi:ribosomal protein S12 methylthiotransferase accessory factor|uniref:YcaO-like family protein n=1 Tax=Desulfobulbus sp. TaxID=895 RepID=UPI00284ED325|nr:YcaO-like family protein [Desulfobulbus sp.]MDR2551045.1 YcaO-like family protein [Desulfobulbus sp.]